MHLGVAQLVARYLGVVEAASSSLVTQTKPNILEHRKVDGCSASFFAKILALGSFESRAFFVLLLLKYSAFAYQIYDKNNNRNNDNGRHRTA